LHYTPVSTNIALQKWTRNEDVFPIENGESSIAMLLCQRVYFYTNFANVSLLRQALDPRHSASFAMVPKITLDATFVDMTRWHFWKASGELKNGNIYILRITLPTENDQLDVYSMGH